jgi:hypothetical protein
MNNMHGPGQAAYYMTLAGLLDRAGTAEPADPMACQRLAVDSVDVCYTAAAMTPEERRGVMGLADGPFYEASDELLADTFDHRSPR